MKFHVIVPSSLLLLPILFRAAENEFPNWKITPDVSAPRAIVVRNADGTTRPLWYVAFNVKNSTGAARKVVPFVNLTTETGKSYPAIYDIDAMETIRAFEGKDTVDLFELTGELADGDSKRVAAVFERVDPLANDLTFHFQGFGAPIVRKGKDYTAQQIDYVTKFHRFGNEHQPTSAPITLLSSDWVTVATRKIR